MQRVLRRKPPRGDYNTPEDWINEMYHRLRDGRYVLLHQHTATHTIPSYNHSCQECYDLERAWKRTDHHVIRRYLLSKGVREFRAYNFL